MLSGPTKIPYALLFGGDSYILFSLCPIPGLPLHGLLCSDILHLLDPTTPFMPLIVFCLLRAGGTITEPPPDIHLPMVKLVSPLGRTRQATQRSNLNPAPSPAQSDDTLSTF